MKFDFWIDLLLLIPFVIEYFNPTVFNYFLILRIPKIPTLFEYVQSASNFTETQAILFELA